MQICGGLYENDYNEDENENVNEKVEAVETCARLAMIGEATPTARTVAIIIIETPIMMVMRRMRRMRRRWRMRMRMQMMRDH